MLTYSVRPIAWYRTPATCGRPLGEAVASMQNDRLAIALTTCSSAGV
jgi:hypothetical protein